MPPVLRLKHALAALCVLSLLAPAALAERPGGGPHDGEMGMFQELDLSDKQRESIRAIKEQNAAKGRQLHEQISNKRKALMHYMGSPNATEAQALDMQRELTGLHARMGEMRVKTWFAMRKNLSAEQLKKMQDIRQRMEKEGPKQGPKPAKRMGGHGPRPGGESRF